MTTVRQAEVACPCCGHRFIVRDNGGLPKDKADRIFKAINELSDAMDRGFRKLFHPSLWK